jgi:hypothetical protein
MGYNQERGTRKFPNTRPAVVIFFGFAKVPHQIYIIKSVIFEISYQNNPYRSGGAGGRNGCSCGTGFDMKFKV